MAEKVVNYTTEQVAEAVERYMRGDSVEAIANDLGKTTRSVVAKLSREGVYVAKSKAKATARVRKDVLVKQIADAIGASEEQLDSLEKATSTALALILNAVVAK